jgi:hypothetical protein
MRIARFKQLSTLASAAALLAIAALAAGCGSSSNESSTTETAPPPQATTSTAPPGSNVQNCTSGSADTTQLLAVGVSCNLARATASAWGRVHTCSGSKSSRYSCTVGQFRCQSATTDRGTAVNCAGPGRSISFIARRG